MNSMNPREQRLVSFVMGHADKWRDYRDSNYMDDWNSFERLWGGVWSGEERTRDSERSRVVSPALQAAVENYQAEIDEAIFGRGDVFFDIQDNLGDENKLDVEILQKALKNEFKVTKLRHAISEIVLNMAIYGTGIGELIIKKETRAVPATEALPLPGLQAVGVMEQEYVTVRLHPVHPRNFLIDPAARDIDSAMGVAVEEFVPAYTVYEAMESGDYTKKTLGKASTDDDLETYQEDEVNDADRIKLLRWYGKVPKALLSSNGDAEDKSDSLDDVNYDWMYSDMVEAVIVIANDGELLKAVENPYMMRDRPIVAAQCDIRPGRFWGRGICEKGAPMQKVIDGQLRAHLDFSALTAVPMMGIDSTRLPRGFKFEVRPGRSILTVGNPSESLMPLKIGETSPLNVQTAELFERFLMMATNTMDSKSIPSVNSDDGGNALAAIIKKNKRTLTSFQDNFLVPLIERMAWRYMQFDPDRFPVKDVSFIPVSTMGVVARNYEMQLYINMLSTLGPQSPVVPLLLTGVLESSSLTNREELIQKMTEMSTPDPEQQQQEQQMAQQAAQMKMQELQATIEKLQAEAQKISSEAQKIVTETQLYPDEVRGRLIASLTKNSEEADEFAQRVKIAELALKEAEIGERANDRISNERISLSQMRQQ